MLNEETIKKLEEKGFKRWQKGNMDRLYVNPKAIGLEVWYYKSGNVSDAEWLGSRISNCEARRMLGAKTYIDVATGHVHSDHQDLEERAAELLKEAM